MQYKPIRLLLLAASLLAASLHADSDLLIQSFNSSGNISWSHSEDTGCHRVEWASSLTGPWQSTWTHLTGIPANGGVSQASVPMFYRVVWYDDDALPSATVTTNMIEYGTETQEILVSGESQGMTETTDIYSGTLAHKPVIAGSLTIFIAGVLFSDNGAGTLIGGNGGTINYGTGAWTARFTGIPSPGSQISATYQYLTSAAIFIPEITVAGEQIGVSVSGAVNYAGVLDYVTVEAGSLTILMGGLVFYDTGSGLLVATGGSNGTINYDTGLWRLSIAGAIPPDLPITASYRAVENPPDGETTTTTEVTVTNESQGTTTSGCDYYSGSLAHRPLVAGGVTIAANGYVFTDNGAGVFIGYSGGTINYSTGVWSIDFGFSPSAGIPITASYTYLESSTMPPPVRILNEPAGQGISGCAFYAGKLAHIPDPGSLSIVAGGYGFEEGLNGALLSPYGTGTIYYATGVWTLSFPAAVLGEGDSIKASYKVSVSRAPSSACSRVR